MASIEDLEAKVDALAAQNARILRVLRTLTADLSAELEADKAPAPTKASAEDLARVRERAEELLRQQRLNRGRRAAR